MISAAIKKYGETNFCFEVLSQFKNREDALKEEKQLIAEFGTLAPYGYNIHEGGGAPPMQKKIDEQTAKKIINQLLDLTISRKTIANNNKVSYAIVENINCGKTWRQEDLQYPLRPNEHQVEYLRSQKIKDLLKNSLLSQEDIAKRMGLSKSEISNINTGKAFYDENDSYPLRKPVKGKIGKAGKRVIQFTLQSEYIQEFETVAQAAKVSGLNRSSIAKCCRGEQKSCGGYKWKYKVIS